MPAARSLRTARLSDPTASPVSRVVVAVVPAKSSPLGRVSRVPLDEAVPLRLAIGEKFGCGEAPSSVMLM